MSLPLSLSLSLSLSLLVLSILVLHTREDGDVSALYVKLAVLVVLVLLPARRPEEDCEDCACASVPGGHTVRATS